LVGVVFPGLTLLGSEVVPCVGKLSEHVRSLGGTLAET
jgi:hypothetical protein